jgi:uncharacterized protein
MFNKGASSFVEKVMNERDENGELFVCIPSKVFTEFINVVTRQNVKHPLKLGEAILMVQEYIKTGVKIVHQKQSQIINLIQLLEKTTTRKKVFDVALATTLKDNGIRGLYTLNVKDFIEFEFLDIKNPLGSNY